VTVIEAPEYRGREDEGNDRPNPFHGRLQAHLLLSGFENRRIHRNPDPPDREMMLFSPGRGVKNRWDLFFEKLFIHNVFLKKTVRPNGSKSGDQNSFLEEDKKPLSYDGQIY
jgi:hypothetical protein